MILILPNHFILMTKTYLQDTNKFDKSILNEAKALARTFEELALKTDSGCKHINQSTEEIF